jgi:biopolymer transport protein ExbD
MKKSPSYLLALFMVVACSSQTASSAPTAASVAVQPGDVPNTMHQCSISGDINTYLNSLKTKDPATYTSTKAEWADAQSKGATATQVMFYTDSAANCENVASTVANLSAAAYPLVVNFSVEFKDEASAANGYTSGQIFGIDRTMLKANGAPVVEGTNTGLGPNSIVLNTTILNQAFYIAVWQNKAFMVILGIINLDSAAGQKVAAAENRRIK